MLKCRGFHQFSIFVSSLVHLTAFRRKCVDSRASPFSSAGHIARPHWASLTAVGQARCRETPHLSWNCIPNCYKLLVPQKSEMNFEIYTVMYYFILFAYIIVQFGWKARNVIDKGHLGFCLSSLSLLHVRLCESYWPPRTANLTTFLTDLFKHGIILDSLTMYLSYIQIHTYHIVNHRTPCKNP